MVSRFLFQKFSDGMSRSTNLLGSHGILGNIFHGSAVHLPVMTGIHGYATKYFQQTFSSSLSKQAEMAAKQAEICIMQATKYFQQTFSSSLSKQAEMAAKQAQDAARKPEIPLRGIAQKDVDTTIALYTLSGVGLFYILSNDDSGGTNKGSRCNCQCHGSNVKQD